MRPFRLITLALLLVLALPIAPAGARPATGLQGTVKQPEGGMCLADDPCDGVGRGIVLLFTRPGQVQHRARSDSDGHFRIRLAPGRYSVRSVVTDARTAPASVVVPKRGFARVTITVFAASSLP